MHFLFCISCALFEIIESDKLSKGMRMRGCIICLLQTVLESPVRTDRQALCKKGKNGTPSCVSMVVKHSLWNQQFHFCEMVLTNGEMRMSEAGAQMFNVSTQFHVPVCSGGSVLHQTCLKLHQLAHRCWNPFTINDICINLWVTRFWNVFPLSFPPSAQQRL